MIEENEVKYLKAIQAKDCRLRDFLNSKPFPDTSSSETLFQYLTEIKSILGNHHNDISFVASLLAKEFLIDRFEGLTWDAAEKAQGAPGLDIDLIWNDLRIIGEIKTTVPYQKGFGAQQKAAIKKDLKKLRENEAAHKFMMVTSDEAYETLRGQSFKSLLNKIEVVNLTQGDSFTTL